MSEKPPEQPESPPNPETSESVDEIEFARNELLAALQAIRIQTLKHGTGENENPFEIEGHLKNALEALDHYKPRKED